MDKYVFSGSHFEKSKMAAVWISVQMETLVFWLLILSSFQKCIVFSKRQRITLRLLYAIAIPSVVCLSVVCRLLSVTLVHPTQPVASFSRNQSHPVRALSICTTKSSWLFDIFIIIINGPRVEMGERKLSKNAKTGKANASVGHPTQNNHVTKPNLNEKGEQKCAGTEK